jgi:uncharacterized membrane protein
MPTLGPKVIGTRPLDSPSAGPPPTTSRTRPPTYRHPVNQMVFDAAPVGARVADRITGFMGSWPFIIIQTVLVVLWLTANVILL